MRSEPRQLRSLLLGLILITGASSIPQKDEQSSQIHSKQDFPTLYEYFATENGQQPIGLAAEQDGFKLNGKLIRLVSGAMHYFRIHPAQWRDRLKKLRASGANTIETYVPWNLHEPRQDEFDFGDGDNDFSSFLDLRRFIQMAQEEDLLVLFRPGPYICSEWDFGGLPSWLQRDPNMKVRTAYQPYLDRVKIYFDKLLPLIADLQFTQGGPIIAIQLENEYGSFKPISLAYLEHIQTIYESNSIDCLHFTSDGAYNGAQGTLPGILMTANFQTNPEGNLDQLMALQPDKPLMVMEFWTGWFDHWFENHHTVPIGQFGSVLETILDRYNASVNFYMFHGGTNFGFMAGANSNSQPPFYDADVTSYDYDSPLSEAGDYADKYSRAMELIEMYQVPQLHRPEMIPESIKTAYPTVDLQTYLDFGDILQQIPSSAQFVFESPVSMENLPMNGGMGPFSGQSYGYILYRTRASIPGRIIYKAGPVRDFAIFMVDGRIRETNDSNAPHPEYWMSSEREVILEGNDDMIHTFDLLIENTARINFGWEDDFLQQKGLPNGSITVDSIQLTPIEVIALEFKSNWLKNLTNWKNVESADSLVAPCLIQSTFEISDEPTDTFVDMSAWHKGIVFINGFNLGRYFKVGPPQTLYIPAPLLNQGTNTITIFEQLDPGNSIVFRDTPILGSGAKKNATNT